MKVKPIVLLYLLLLGSLISSAQPYETFYFNKQGLKTTKSNAYTYRTIVGKEDGNLKVKDFYMDGTLRMTGVYGTTNHAMLSGPSSVVLREGDFVYYFPNGKIEKQTNCIAGQPDGIWTHYYNDSTGQIKELRHYRVGIPIRTWKTYYLNGTLKGATDYLDGELDGLYTRYNKDGVLIKKLIYTRGEKVRDETPEEILLKETKSIRQTATPSYNIGKYLKKHVRYPAYAKKRHKQGKVIVAFVIDEEGEITDVMSTSIEVYYSLQMEAVRVISEMPKWKPATKNGQPIKVHYRLPITFSIK